MPEEESPIPPEAQDFKAPEEVQAPEREQAHVEKRINDWVEKNRKEIGVKPGESYAEAALRHAWRTLTGRNNEEKPKE